MPVAPILAELQERGGARGLRPADNERRRNQPEGADPDSLAQLLFSRQRVRTAGDADHTVCENVKLFLTGPLRLVFAADLSADQQRVVKMDEIP